MGDLRVVTGDDAAASLSGTVLFGILWDELVDLLGSAATASLLRRALQRALARRSELSGLTIDLLDGEYGFVLPPAFATGRGPPAALCELLDELRPLLVELLGGVAVRHLDRNPALQGWPPASSTPA